MNLRTLLWSGVLFALVLSSRALGAGYQLPEKTPGDRMLAGYFRTETASISTQCLAEIKSLSDWDAQRGRFREELQEMLGLSPLPAKTDLKAVVTGRVERDDFVVETLHFQS
jgi:hypothetical protein